MVTEVVEFPRPPRGTAAGAEGADVGAAPAPDAALVHHLGEALRTSAALLDADAGAALTPMGESGAYLAASTGLSADELAALRRRAARAAGPVSAAVATDAGNRHEPLHAAAPPLSVRAPDGRAWGSIALYYREPRPSDPERVRVCESYLCEVGWALERDRRAAELERTRAARVDAPLAVARWDREVAIGEPAQVVRAAERPGFAADAALDDATARLRRVAGALLRATDARAVHRAAAGQAIPASGARAAAVLLRDDERGVLRVGASAGDHARLPGLAAELPLDGPHPAAEAAMLHRPCFVEGSGAAAPRSPARPHRRPTAGTVAALPLMVGDSAVAVLLLDFAAPRALDPATRAMLVALAGMAGQALERVQLTVAARAASVAKSDFLAMMSHELRTPLNAIMGYTGLIADEVVGPVNDTQREQLRRVQDQARHLLSLVEEVLTLTRAESGAERLHLEPVDPAGLLRDVVQVLAPSASRKGLTIESRVADVPRQVTMDADKVRQVLAHLLTNAVKFTDVGGIVGEVRGDAEGAALVFSVRDTGIGIASENLAHIFEPFWQAERTHARRAAGTGLGLNVTRRLADLLGGEVAVESTPGRGSTFTLRVPVSAVTHG